MKWPQDQYDILKNAMQLVIDDVVLTKKLYDSVEALKESLLDPDATVTVENQRHLVWGCWRVASYDLMYDDTHPAFAGGRRIRIVPHDPAYQSYPKGCNDSHLDTAIKAIAKDLGLVFPAAV